MNWKDVGVPALLAAWTLGAVAGCRAAGQADEWPGLGAVLSPLQEPEEGPPGCCSGGAKERIHVFAVNGVDPLCVANLNGLCAYLRCKGYSNTHFGRLFNSQGFADDIRRVRKDSPGARVVLVGFSYGCTRVRAIANALAEDDVPVDLMVYIAGDLITDDACSRPPNVRRLLNIRARGMLLLGGDLLFNKAEITGARNVRLACAHFAAPSQMETISLVLEELAALCEAPPTK